MHKHYSNVLAVWQVSNSIIMPAVPDTKQPIIAWAELCGDGKPSASALQRNPSLRAHWAERPAPGPRNPYAHEQQRMSSFVTDAYAALTDRALPDGAVVVDLDHPEKLDLMLALMREAGVAPSPFITKTKNGGLHFWYRREPGMYAEYKSQNQCRTLTGERPEGPLARGEGLYDIKAYRAYVMAPGSGTDARGYRLFVRDWATGEEGPVVMTDDTAALVPVLPYAAYAFLLRNDILAGAREAAEERAPAPGESAAEKAKRRTSRARLAEAARTRGKLARGYITSLPPEWVGLTGTNDPVACPFCSRDASRRRTFWNAETQSLTCFGCHKLWHLRKGPVAGDWSLGGFGPLRAAQGDQNGQSGGSRPESPSGQHGAAGVASGTSADGFGQSDESRPESHSALTSSEVSLEREALRLTPEGYIIPPVAWAASTLLTSGTGSGKTHALRAVVDAAKAAGRRVVALAPLVELVRGLAARLGIADYTDDRSASAAHWARDVATTVKSMGKLRFEEDERFIVLIDESEEALRQFASLCSDEEYALLLSILGAAEQVIICEAYPTQTTIRMMEDSGRPAWTIYTAPRREREITPTTVAAAKSALMEHFAARRVVFVYCDSRQEADAFATTARGHYNEDDVVVRHADSKPLPTDDYSKCKVLICTKTLGTGVDISVKDHYDQVFAFVENRSATVEGGATYGEVMQAIARVRHPKNPSAIVAVRQAAPFNMGLRGTTDYWMKKDTNVEGVKALALRAAAGTKAYVRATPWREYVRLRATIKASDVRAGAGWLGEYLCTELRCTLVDGVFVRKERAKLVAAKKEARAAYVARVRAAEATDDRLDRLVSGAVAAATDEEALAAQRERLTRTYGEPSDMLIAKARSSAFAPAMRRRVAVYLAQTGQLGRLATAESKSRYGEDPLLVFGLKAANTLERLGYLGSNGHVRNSSVLSEEEMDAAYVELAQERWDAFLRGSGCPRATLSQDRAVLDSPELWLADVAGRRARYCQKLLRLVGRHWDGVERHVETAAERSPLSDDFASR